MTIANDKAKKFNISFTKLSDISIPLDKLLQIMLAFVEDGYSAYTKKSCVLKSGHPIYKNFSMCLLDYLTIDSIINIYLLHQKAEIEKKERKKNNTGDGRNPIPYYLISFLGDYFKTDEKAKDSLNNIFKDEESINSIYDWLKDITTEYYKMYVERNHEDYNRMIKQKIDDKILNEIKENYIRWGRRKDPIKDLLNKI